jgi:hypothetical protein
LFYWIYDYSTLNIGGLFAFVFVASTWLLIFLFRLFFHHRIHSDTRANDMVGFALASFSVLYGLLVGLLAVAAYQNFSTVSDLVTREASSVAALYSDLRAYPQPIKGRLLHGLNKYTRTVIDRSWPEQQRGMVPDEESHLISEFIDDLMAFEPSKKSEEILHAETFRQLNITAEIRRSRLANINTGIPAVFWWVVAVGSLISIILLAMLDMEIRFHLALSGTSSLFLGLVIFLIAAMDNPFRGEISVGPDPFVAVYDTVMKPTDAVMKSMAVLVGKAAALGPPRLAGHDLLAGKDVPVLYFGTAKMNNVFDMVDTVAAESGGTATLFVKAREDYVRVATNIRMDDGSRATGTILDPNGPVIAKIAKGEAFYGEATILDKPYITGYEPIKDTSGEVIGIFYVGYQKPAPQGASSRGA